AKKPEPYELLNGASVLANRKTQASTEQVTTCNKEIDKFLQKDFTVKQQIFSTVTDHMLLCISMLNTSTEVWLEV
ncbi:hypothetical protein HYDPIDRAFT_56174, partial [Hydnomerulius pinastri MD-312]